MPHKLDGYTIFCDDIRQEIGNKQSLMGIYGTEMHVHKPFPTAMHRMGFHIVLREDLDAPLTNMTLCIFLPGDEKDKPTYKAEIERSAGQIPPPPPNSDPSTRRMFALNVVLNPVVLKEPGHIRVRMLVGNEEVKLGSLVVKQGEIIQQAA
jgi:hypothetical protein